MKEHRNNVIFFQPLMISAGKETSDLCLKWAHLICLKCILTKMKLTFFFVCLKLNKYIWYCSWGRMDLNLMWHFSEDEKATFPVFYFIFLMGRWGKMHVNKISSENRSCLNHSPFLLAMHWIFFSNWLWDYLFFFVSVPKWWRTGVSSQRSEASDRLPRTVRALPSSLLNRKNLSLARTSVTLVRPLAGRVCATYNSVRGSCSEACTFTTHCSVSVPDVPLAPRLSHRTKSTLTLQWKVRMPELVSHCELRNRCPVTSICCSNSARFYAKTKLYFFNWLRFWTSREGGVSSYVLFCWFMF